MPVTMGLPPSSDDHYTFLGLERNASVAEIEAAMARVSGEADAAQPTSPQYALLLRAQLHQVRADLLTSPTRREAYDRTLDAPRPPAPVTQLGPPSRGEGEKDDSFHPEYSAGDARQAPRRRRLAWGLPLIAIVIVAAVLMTELWSGWRPSIILAEKATPTPTPNLVATATADEPAVWAAVRLARARVTHSAACACDANLRAALTGAALTAARQRVLRLRQLIRHRTTVVRRQTIDATHVILPATANVTMTDAVTEYQYQGSVLTARSDVSYRHLYHVVRLGGVWMINRIQTHTVSRSVHHVVSAPAVSARAVYIVDDSNGRALYAYNANTPRLVASTAKIITALVAIQHLSLNAVVTVPPEAVVGGTTANLVPGEQFTARQLFYGMLLPSGNDAAVTLGIAAAGSVTAFAGLMNREAARLHLTHSHFVTPHGMDTPGQYSSAHDLAIAAHALLRQPFLASVVRTQTYDTSSLDASRTPHHWVTTNELLGSYPGMIGVKTGTTPGAGANLVAAAVRGGRRLIVVELNDTTTSRFPDARALLDYGWRLLGQK